MNTNLPDLTNSIRKQIIRAIRVIRVPRKRKANILLTSASVGEIVLYQPNDSVKLEVRLENETVWLTQSQMAELFSVKVPAVSKHIKNIFDEGELEVISTVSKKEIVRKEGNREVKRWIDFYNLDVIISVGYRIKSIAYSRHTLSPMGDKSAQRFYAPWLLCKSAIFSALTEGR